MKYKLKYKIIFTILVVLIVLSKDYFNIKNRILNIGVLGRHTLEHKPKLVILIEVDKKRLSLVNKEDGQVLNTYPIASGKSTSPTPLGSFQVVQKAHWGEGFGSRWIGLNVPWGIYGIHGTNKPGSIGSNVSAGCIRMRNSDVEELYEKISKDTSVIIINGQYGPFGQGFRTLKPGDRGADVLEVQKRLSRHGFYDGGLDGIYGEVMKKSLIEFLKAKGISLTDKIDYSIYEKLGIILMD